MSSVSGRLRNVRRTAIASAMVVLAACGSTVPSPPWALEAQTAVERAVQAQLKGEARVAQSEWARAWRETSATGDPAHTARVALVQCAARMAALEDGAAHCAAYQRYASGARAQEQAYAAYLQQALASAADVSLLPAAQQATATKLLQRQVVDVLPEDASALSQLTAAAVAQRAGLLGDQALTQVADIAAAQGWRKAAMAWLLVLKQRLQATHQYEAVPAVDMRLEILQGNGVQEIE